MQLLQQTCRERPPPTLNRRKKITGSPICTRARPICLFLDDPSSRSGTRLKMHIPPYNRITPSRHPFRCRRKGIVSAGQAAHIYHRCTPKPAPGGPPLSGNKPLGATHSSHRELVHRLLPADTSGHDRGSSSAKVPRQCPVCPATTDHLPLQRGTARSTFPPG